MMKVHVRKTFFLCTLIQNPTRKISWLRLCTGMYSSWVRLCTSFRLEKYINRLYLSWTSGDIIHLRTGHSNPENWRVSMFKYENIVLIWNFPRKLKARQTKDCICKAFAAHTSQRSYSLTKLKRLVSNQEQET
ncbi:hypothetical protein BRARA_E01447 [Brassica rapa]|uniref:Uncharacterized protein n=1 Tax=Brassica campestris TaxID=3711 RepID=A0A397ZG66_BRACM|nr:poly(A)-specific ribonuclease PARN-like [Brassica napus]XP_048636875.1 poly(A)-specific ribonuclease PARN-like [Brassica napus]RID62370.1 hypothetical protein BRARA_E01447 [Brassica rapa]